MAGPLDAVKACVLCQGIKEPIPSITEPGLPSLTFAGANSMVEGVKWNLELNAVIALSASTGNPAPVIDFLPKTPNGFMNEVFLQPFTSGIAVPVPDSEISFGPINGLPIPAFDNTGLLESQPKRYGPDSNWPNMVPSFLKLFTTVLAMPFMMYWSMVEAVTSVPLELPPPPSPELLEAIFVEVAKTQGLDSPEVGKLGGCMAEGLMKVVF